MTPTRPFRAAILAAVILLAAATMWQALTVDAASVTTFTTSERVRVLTTGELGTVDHVVDGRVVVFGDASGAQLRAYAPGDIEPYAPPEPPPVSTPGSASGWNGFGVGAWPPASWRPYRDNSPFNQRITVDAAAHPSSGAMVNRVLSWGLPGNLFAGGAGTSYDYGHPTYWAQPDDPIYTLDSLGYSPDVDGMKIRIPSDAQPAGGGDGHLTVVEPDGYEYDFWQVTSKPAGGGTMTFQLGGRTRIDGDGLGSNAVAARYGNLAGIIRAQEISAGRIDHALFIVLKCTSSSTSFGYGTKTDGSSKSAFVYPALAGGSRCGSTDNDAPPMGAHFQLAMSDAQIDAFAVPGWKKAILRALARYGGYVGDTGGPGFGLQFESGATYTSFGQTDPLVTFAKAAGLPTWNGLYVFNLAPGVDWAKYLRVLPPPS